MSRFRSSNDDLAYGDIPQRWDRERFERFGRYGPGAGPAPAHYESDIRVTERDRPGRHDVAVAERRESSRPGGRWEERDRFFEEERARSRPRRRTDKELFGEVDPREIADLALTPYRRTSVTREDFDIDQRAPRPGTLLRRQSSLDTFDRRPRYEKEEYRIPPYAPIPLPIRRSRGEWEDYHYNDDDMEDYREVEIQRERSVRRRRPRRSEPSVKEEKISYHHHHSDTSSSSSTDVEEEIEEVKSKAPSRKSSRATTIKAASTKAPSTKAPSTKAMSTKAPSVYESVHETVVDGGGSSSSSSVPPALSVHGSVHETVLQESMREERRFKKGKTRMPKRLVRREAIMDLGYPFDEEEDFFVLRIALEKEQIDEVIQISETYKDGEKRKVYKFEENIEETIEGPAPGEHEEIQRTEWINPPTVVGSHSHSHSHSHRSKSVRDTSPNVKSSISQRISPARTSRSRRPSGTFLEERKTVIEETRSPPPPTASRAPSAPPPPPAPEFYEERKTIIEERVPSHHHSHHVGTVVLAEREHRSDRDINAEIRALEQERQVLRHEREADQKRDLALQLRGRPEEEIRLVDYRSRSRPREELVIYEREKSPARNVLRVEKDRKGRMAFVRSAH